MIEPGGADRAALLVGFARGLEDALAGLLGPHGFTIHRVGTVADAVTLLAATPAHLVVASGRCPAASVVRLVAALGEPRTARVLVMLAGRDVEAERRYREAGLKHIMTMPVTVAEILRVGGMAEDPPRAGHAQ